MRQGVTSQNTMRHIVAAVYCAVEEKGNIVMVGQYPFLFDVVCAILVYLLLYYYMYLLFDSENITYLLDSYNTAAV